MCYLLVIANLTNTPFIHSITLKIVTLISILLLLSTDTNAQNLSRSEKIVWKKGLDKMEETDQIYRKLMVKSPELNNDSIWAIQSSLDSTNRINFIELTNLYGYPSKKNIGREASIALILHFTLEKDFRILKNLFKSELDKGNMLPEYYAWWYDRCQRNMGNAIYYGQYTNQKEFCGDEWTTFNENRKEIGLTPLIGKVSCD